MSNIYRAKAIRALRPDSVYHMVGDVIHWKDDTVSPNEEEIIEKIVEIKYEEEIAQYQRNRANAYPSIQEQLDTIFHSGLDVWKSQIQEVKDIHPKLTIDETVLNERKAQALFDRRLALYTEAVERLDHYKLAEGRPEEETDFILSKTARYDDNGEIVIDENEAPVFDIVYETIPAIDPLPATVADFVFDEDGNATEVEVTNPSIVKDEEERAKAQAIVDSTPQEVINYYQENIQQ